MTALVGGQIFTGAETVSEKALLLEGKLIKGLVAASEIPADATRIDCHDRYIAPGFIDLQVYGSGGHLFSNQPSAGTLKAIADALVKSGTTGFAITLATNPPGIVQEAIRVVRENPHPAVLGLHLEGPWLNPVKRGAHIESLIHPASPDEVKKLLTDAGGAIAIVTLAPEMNDPVIIHLLRDAGVVVSAGHSNASFEQAVEGFRNGIGTVTHLFNAMSAFHHRDTGLPGAAFLSSGVYASIIADGIHVDFNTLRISKQIMGNRLFLITDAVEATAEGPYTHVKKRDRYTLPDGTLSGSALTMIQAVHNCVEQAGMSLEEAVRMATLYPALVAGRPDIGHIAPECLANLVVFTKDYRIDKVFLGGVVQ